MAKIISEARVLEYSNEFKVLVVKLTQSLNINITEIAQVMDLHPVMVYRWRQEYREGQLVDQPSRRIKMTKSSKPTPPDKDKELKKLLKENEKLKKENEFLKKWDAFLKEQRRKGSSS
jgi:transposase